MGHWGKRGILLCLFCLCTPVFVMADEYMIGPDDLLEVTFWQQRDLDVSVTVAQGGKITLPIIGRIQAAGWTPAQLEKRIVELISPYNSSISQVSVVVRRYGSEKVYVTGQVLSPGKYTFEAIRSLWEVVMEAGGPTQMANLKNVNIIRGEGEQRRIISVDLTEFLETGNESILPDLRSGDTVHIPERVGISTGGGSISPLGGDVVYVYGQVARPGPYTFSDQIDLLEAIIMAGGPTSQATMDKVRIITREQNTVQVTTVDVDEYSLNGVPSPFPLRPGDTIFIPRQKATFFQGAWRVTRNISSVLGTVISTYLLIDRLNQ